MGEVLTIVVGVSVLTLLYFALWFMGDPHGFGEHIANIHIGYMDAMNAENSP